MQPILQTQARGTDLWGRRHHEVRSGSLLCERRAYNSGLSESVRERDRGRGIQISRRYFPLSFAGSLSWSAGIEGLQSWSDDRRVRVVAGRSTKCSINWVRDRRKERERERERTSKRWIRGSWEILREQETTTSDVPRERSSGKRPADRAKDSVNYDLLSRGIYLLTFDKYARNLFLW